MFLVRKTWIMSLNKKTEVPLCKFGPGGDYVFNYTPDDSNSRFEFSFFEAVKVIAESISMRLPLVAEHKKMQTKSIERHNRDKYYACQDGNTESFSSVSAKQTVFTDNKRACGSIWKEPSNRIRTLRRPPKKRFSVCFTRENPLFEAH